MRPRNLFGQHGDLDTIKLRETEEKINTKIQNNVQPLIPYSEECCILYTSQMQVYAMFQLANIPAKTPDLDEIEQCKNQFSTPKKPR